MRLRAKIRKFVIKYFSEITIFLLKKLNRKKGDIKNDRILIIRLATLGETLLTFPMVKAIRQEMPSSRIYILTQIRELWKSNPDVDEIIDYSFFGLIKIILSRYRYYDIVIDTEPGNKITAIAAFLLGKTAVGFDTVNRAPMYDFPVPFNDQQYEALSFLDLLKPLDCSFSFNGLIEPIPSDDNINIRKYKSMLSSEKIKIGINLGASHAFPERLWPLDNYGTLIQRLNNIFNCQFVFFGLKMEQEMVKELKSYLKGIKYVDFTNSINLNELIKLLPKMDIFLSSDTGLMHLAAAIKIPVFSFFGPNLPVRFAPRNDGSKFFYPYMSCSPCINVHLPQSKTLNNCNGECTKAISVDEVFYSISDFLNMNNKKKSSEEKSIYKEDSCDR